MEAKQYIYQIKPARPDLMESMTEEEGKIISDHFLYLQNYLNEGKLILAGPCLDSAFGVVIFEAASVEEAKQIMENDPAVQYGVMTAELHEFKVSLIRA